MNVQYDAFALNIFLNNPFDYFDGTLLISNTATTCQLAVMRVLVVCLLNIMYANTFFDGSSTNKLSIGYFASM